MPADGSIDQCSGRCSASLKCPDTTARQGFVCSIWSSTPRRAETTADIGRRLGASLVIVEGVSEARASIGRYLEFYNRRRPQSSLDGVTPDQAYFTPLPFRMAA